MAITIEFLSASNSGEPIQITATESPGTIIHSGVAGTSQKDEVYAYANNTGNYIYPLVVEYAGTGLSNRISTDIFSRETPLLISPGFLVNNDATIRAFSPSGASLIRINGYVQRGP